MTKIIIGLTGPAGVGKSAFSRELSQNWGYHRMSLADPLKLSIRAVLKSWGYNDAACDYWIDGDGKEKPCPALAYQSPRLAMQLLGTEWGRQGLGNEMWVNHLIKRIEASPYPRIVVDDVRFNNEASGLVMYLDALMFGIAAKPGSKPRRAPPPHASEAGVAKELLDDTYFNDFTFEGVAEAVRMMNSMWSITPTLEGER